MSYIITACIAFVGFAGCDTPPNKTDPAPAPEIVKAEPEKIEVEVLHISEEFANINTNISREELAAKGITEGGWIAVSYKGKTYPMLLGKDYSDVEKGAWIARFDEEDNRLQLAVSFGNAATDMGVAVGDKLEIQMAEASGMGGAASQPSMESAKSQPAN